jgi:selenocysteine-specific elongation factor
MEPRRFAIVGTAGHIDHGKTSLVKLLTGTDTDRLKEEKERGISIDLGFAHLRLPGAVDCGIVDVPGHERFVRNMLAGVGGIDAVLLVIAADEGVMPQTREHFDIIRILGVTRGVVALTKIDMVEPEWIELVSADVREYLAGSPFAEAPIVPVSSRTGAGKNELLQALSATLRDLPAREAGRPARLPIDRVFVVEGFGTVVTGTLWSGAIRTGDRVVIEPGGIETRVRSVQVHNNDVTEAVAGQRTAVALHGVDRAKIGRGDWVLAAPPALAPSFMLDLRIAMLADCPRPLVNRQRVRFHLGASETLGRVILLDREELEPGESAVAQLRLEAPVVADRGDRFVLRSYSPQRAIGGGTVVVPNPDKHRRHDPQAVSRLEVEEGGGARERVRQALASMPFGAAPGAVARASGIAADETAEALEGLRDSGAVISLGDGRWIALGELESLAGRVMSACRAYQEGGSFRWGMARGELKSRLPKEVDALLFDAVIDFLLEQDRLFRRADRFRADTPELALTEREKSLRDRTLEEFRKVPFSPPSLKELDEALRAGPLLPEILAHAVVEGVLVKITSEIYYLDEALREMERRLRVFFATREEMRVADLKELFGMSRRHAVPILEHFDRTGLTRRAGDVRLAGRTISRGD